MGVAGERRVPALDGLRGVAILLVMLGHARIGPTETAGPVGVTVFFVLSGYLISGIVLDAEARTGWSWRAFYMRRAARLLPALVVMLGVLAAFLAAAGAWSAVFERSALAALGYVANWRLISGPEGPIAQTWSLSVEEQFYLIWPVTLLVLTRRGMLRWVPWVAVGFLGLRLAAWHWVGFDWSLYGTFMCSGALLSGGALHALPRPLLPAGLKSGCLAVMLALCLLPYDDGWAPAATVATALLACVLVSNPQLPLLEPGWLRYLGRISYGIYLWHFPLLWIAMGFTDKRLVHVAVEWVGGFTVAAVSWSALEKPILRRIRPEPGNVVYTRGAIAG